MYKYTSNALWGSAGLKMSIHAHIFGARFFDPYSRSDWTGVRSGSLVGLYLQDYKSLCNNNNNNSSFISTADNPQLIQQAATQDSTDTIEHKESVIIQPNITYTD